MVITSGWILPQEIGSIATSMMSAPFSHTSSTVSYTHLDVYKRQKLASVLAYPATGDPYQVNSGDEVPYATNLFFQAEADEGYTVETVSYTHLDVYKRQV